MGTGVRFFLKYAKFPSECYKTQALLRKQQMAEGTSYSTLAESVRWGLRVVLQWDWKTSLRSV